MDVAFWIDRRLSSFFPRIWADESDPVTQENLRRIVSPVIYMDSNTPPMYLVHGVDDTTIPVGHIPGMEEVATAVGNSSIDFQLVENAEHNFRLSGTLPIEPTITTIVTTTTDRLLGYLNENIALGKSTSQSSTSFGAEASRAVDGNTNGEFSQNSVTHTANSIQPFWQVDLGAIHDIDEIVLFNRTNCCSERLNNFTVSVLDAAGETVFSQFVSNVPNPSLSINARGISGRQVRVQLNGTGTLSLAEVEVFGERTVGSNVALGKTVTQSSTALGGVASRATDGNTNGAFDGGSVTHTALTTNPTLIVDLGSQHELYEVVLYNRTDSPELSARLTNFLVTVRDERGVATYSDTFRSYPDPSISIGLGGVNGQTVEVRLLEDSGYLSLAEVEVYGFRN